MSDKAIGVTGYTGIQNRRLSELERYEIIGTPAEKEFDDVAEIAAYLAGTTMAYVSFIDSTHLWFKATHGFEANTVPREQTYCQFVVADERPIAIPDTREESTYVPDQLEGLGEQIRFYVGVPLRSRSGMVLGTLCTVDDQPRDVPDSLIPMLEKLAGQISAQLEVRRTNRMLLEERDTFSTLFEAAPAPLILAEGGGIVRCNFAFADLVTDGDTESLEGVSLNRFLSEVPTHPGTTVETELENTVGGRTAIIVSLTRLHRDQRTYDLVALTDISDRKEKEHVLREQRLAAENANRIKDTFLSLVSHDLRSPLSGISTMLELLDKAGNTFSPEEWKTAIRDLRESAAVLVEMINQLLNIHRLQSGRLEVLREDTAVEMIAQQVVLSLGKQIKDKDLTVTIDIPREFTLDADIGLFREALFNLVSNSIKFSSPGGEIRITREGDEAIVVEDEGTGVPEEDRDDLFRHEVKTSRLGTDGERGTGLGLPLVADIMRAHGGQITYDEEYRNGARFVLNFPSEHVPDPD
ncbi:MAG: GAF domain-containing sensor histidine kinase [Spirochaeta sp.]|nr:GAF domain-containing sensor histidine kinase [Spirochaeta sp.]